MRKIYTLLCSLALASYLPAQSILKLESGTELTIKSGTAFYAGGLVLNPDADYQLTNNELSQHSAVSFYTIHNYAGRVLRWLSPAPAYSGVFRYYYSDDVLNGIPESNLALNAYNGSYWQHVPASSRNATDNYVETGAVSALSVSEFALSDELKTLPLLWGPVQARRQQTGVEVIWSTRQEQQVMHFVVERSTNNREWTEVSEAIEARNQPDEQHYDFTDLSAPVGRTYYRIRQHDLTGTIYYSPVVSVSGEDVLLALYPNPATEGFRLLINNSMQIVQVDLFDIRGARIKSWSKAESWYSLQSLAAGRYHIRVQLLNGEIKNLSLLKQ